MKWKQYRDTVWEVSSSGSVRRRGSRTTLSTVVNNAGYLMVHLHYDGHDRMVPVHRMVAETFVPNPLSLPEIDHLDKNKFHNRASNLRWCTRAQNLHNLPPRKANPGVSCYTLDGVWLRDFRNFSEANAWAGLTSQGIKACCEGWQRTAKGYRWGYARLEQLRLF